MNVYNLLVTVSTSESIDVCFCLAAPAAAAAAAAAPDLIIPKTPKLVSKSRTRKITARSHADVEQDQLEEMKKWDFARVLLYQPYELQNQNGTFIY